MKYIIPLLVSMSLLTMVGTATADGSNKDSQSMGIKSFDSLDVNRDGFINRDEDPEGRFLNKDGSASADTNRDNKLSRQEYDAYVKSVKSHKDWKEKDGMNSGGAPSTSPGSAGSSSPSGTGGTSGNKN
jgi:hypothetical protein